MEIKGWIELIAVVTMPIGLIALAVERVWTGKGVGPRMIQYAGAVLLVPTILILALEKTLEPSTVGTVMGALIGYLLSGISERDPLPSAQPR
jgi:hypothetical protein